MDYSITRVLYDWMHEKRIVTLVAQEMGMKDCTLSAKLRPSNPQAKLSADELVQLFSAVRQVGYGKELSGILHEFVRACQGTVEFEADGTDMIPHVLELVRGLGLLSDVAGRIATISDEEELIKLSTMIRTEILPVVLRMESLVDARLEKLRGHRKRFLSEISVIEARSAEPAK